MAEEFYYPTKLLDSKSNFIRIEAAKYQYGGGGEILGAVSLYHPSGISFADGAGYNTMDMGPLGNRVIEGIQSGQSATDIAKSVNESALGSGSDSDLKAMLSAKIAKDAGLTSMAPGLDNLQGIYGAAKGKAVNANTISSFSNMTIRSFGFNFKMIAENPSESDTIRQIQRFFREHMYPEEGAGSYLLTYPATFKIKFYTPDGKENSYYPKIYESYLTNFTTTLNQSSHLHYDGGAPVEVDINLTFQESKVLTKLDLQQLEAGTSA